MEKYNTNLAAEFFVLSCLHRRGVTAALTLGNKKAVDILVARDAGDSVTVEVKGVAKRYDWPADNIKPKNPENHFVVLICFNGKIADPTMPSPEVWVVPFIELRQFLKHYKGRTNVSRAKVKQLGKAYENAWDHIK